MDLEKIVCECLGVTAGDIKDAVNKGCSSLEEIMEETGAGTACGICTDEVERALDYFVSERKG